MKEFEQYENLFFSPEIDFSLEDLETNLTASSSLKKQEGSYEDFYFNYGLIYDLDNFSNEIEAVIIATPTTFHFKLAKFFIQQKKHVFVEKPITSTTKEAKELILLINKFGLVGQVGHVERFNSAYLNVKNLLNPMFIEAHRLSQYPERGTDVSVVLDLMIHDIDIVLSIVDSSIKSINANGTKVISNSPDIVNARIEFHNGAVANLTASRISLKNMNHMFAVIFHMNLFECSILPNASQKRRSMQFHHFLLQLFTKLVESAGYLLCICKLLPLV